MSEATQWLSIPLEHGQFAHVPIPMTKDDLQLLRETLDLWEDRLTRQLEDK